MPVYTDTGFFSLQAQFLLANCQIPSPGVGTAPRKSFRGALAVAAAMRKQAGFTLIEVMVVVAIIGILSAIALPAYQDYVRRGRVSEAVGTLSNQQSRMEQYFQDKRTYVSACSAGSVAPPMARTTTFTFDCGTPTASGYTLTATGEGAMNGFKYTVNEAGARTSVFDTSTGWTQPNPNNCWALRKDGTC